MNEMQRARRDQEFLLDVRRELERARKKFPSSNLVLGAATEELGELARAMLVQAGHKPPRGPNHDVWHEAVQLAAMALRCAVEGDASFAAVTGSDQQEKSSECPIACADAPLGPGGRCFCFCHNTP